jgi:murein L,D-transpeptidase YafK
MRKIKALALTLLMFPGLAFAEIPGLKEVVVVVDKKTFQLHLANYEDGRLDIVKSVRATMGQKQGDKLMEGDLKTPEGIYDFLFRAQAPGLKAMFGPLAIYVSYPNIMDKAGAKTGFDILVHGTDDPARLEKQFDSKGCVVLDNENVKMVSDVVKLKDTKIIITKDFSQLQNTPRITKAKAFFERWIKAWSNKDLSTYIESYADEFRMDGMNRLAYAKYKDSLNKKYDSITVTASDVRYFFHEKYDLITFTQHYSSTFGGGKPAYSGSSRKNLWLQERNGEYRILVEESRK